MEKCRSPRDDFSEDPGEVFDLARFPEEVLLLVELVGDGAGRFLLTLSSSMVSGHEAR